MCACGSPETDADGGDDPGIAFAWLPVSLAAGFGLLAYVSATELRLGGANRLLGGAQTTVRVEIIAH